MRLGGDSSSSTSTNIWHTPLPYLFAGLGIMMILIAIALIVIAYSHWKASRAVNRNSQSSTYEPDQLSVIVPLDREPKIVVIMAGDDMPSFIAKPILFALDASTKAVPKPSDDHYNQEP